MHRGWISSLQSRSAAVVENMIEAHCLLGVGNRHACRLLPEISAGIAGPPQLLRSCPAADRMLDTLKSCPPCQTHDRGARMACGGVEGKWKLTAIPMKHSFCSMQQGTYAGGSMRGKDDAQQTPRAQTRDRASADAARYHGPRPLGSGESEGEAQDRDREVVRRSRLMRCLYQAAVTDAGGSSAVQRRDRAPARAYGRPHPRGYDTDRPTAAASRGLPAARTALEPWPTVNSLWEPSRQNYLGRATA